MASRFLPHLRPPLLWAATTRTIKILAVAHLFSETICDLRWCSGFSMLPTLSHEGDIVLVSPLPYWSPGPSTSRTPQRGDVIVASSPLDPRNTVCKRVIGLEGDIIEVDPRRDGPGGSERKWIAEVDEIHVGDTLTPVQKEARTLDSEGRPWRGGRNRGQGQYVKIPKGHVWLQGDNMSNSTDSRKYGPVPLGIVKGKVLARVWPNPKWFHNPVEPLGSSR